MFEVILTDPIIDAKLAAAAAAAEKKDSAQDFAASLATALLTQASLLYLVL